MTVSIKKKIKDLGSCRSHRYEQYKVIAETLGSSRVRAQFNWAATVTKEADKDVAAQRTHTSSILGPEIKHRELI